MGSIFFFPKPRYAEVNHSAELADCPHRDLDFEPFGISGLYAAEVNLLGVIFCMKADF